MKKLYIDIGGTYIRSELKSVSGVISQKISSQTIGLFAFCEKQMQENPEIIFIGISYAGQVCDGVILDAPNIIIDEKEIKKRLEFKYSVTVEIDNDLNCAVVAEAEYFKSKNIVALFVGTGLGSASINDGKIVRGSGNLAYELGHIPYKDAPFLCGCGRKNCLELFASGSAIAKWLEYYDSTTSLTLEELRDSKIESEHSIWVNFELALLHAVGILITIANPESLVLGGGVIKNNPYLVDNIKKKIDKFALKSSIEIIKVEISKLDNAPLFGIKLLQERNYG